MMGVRPQDVFRMRWEHLNWFKRVLFIPYGKTRNSRRHVPLSERVIKALELRGASANGWVFSSTHSKSGHISNVANQWRCTRKATLAFNCTQEAFLFLMPQTILATADARRTRTLAVIRESFIPKAKMSCQIRFCQPKCS